MSQLAKRLFIAGCAALLLLPQLSHAADLPTNAAIVKRISADLEILASDEYEGRGVGTEGLAKASIYVRDQFREAGLDVTQVEGGAFQSFNLPSGAEIGEHNALVLKGPDDQSIELKLGEDYEVCSFGGSGKLEAELVFLGYGIENKKLNYSDFEGIDVKGKIVVIMRRTPQQTVKDSPFGGAHGGISRDASLQTKVSLAFGHGAAGILFVNDPYAGRSKLENAEEQIQKAKDGIVGVTREYVNAEHKSDELLGKLKESLQRLDNLREVHSSLETDELMKFGYAGTGKQGDLPIAHLQIEELDKVLQASLGKTLTQLEAAIDSDFKPRSAILSGWKAELQTDIKLIETEVHNVIGVLEGDGPLADEIVVIGAHYDHVGYGGANSLAPNVKEVHNGADDNGSGTVALIELARRFAAAEKPPPRKIVFIAFTAEELGLIGSDHYVKNPVFPLDKTIAMFNMDMVGRLNENKLTVFGTGTSSRWKDLVVEEGEKRDFRLSLQPEGFGPSDHSSFYGKKIPVLHFFTGTHQDYHRPTDDTDKINYEGIVRVADMLEALIENTLENETTPDYIEIAQRANIGRSGSRPYFGSIPDFNSEIPGYTLSGVSPGSPADKAGLKAGDTIVKVGEIKISGLDDFDLALRRFSAGDEIETIVLREGKEVKLKVTLAHPK
ncbi:MAG TPA: M20/M25/M40 family metallo-hydrolase [Planctomycetaceae bacterium]|nr:M20/M25/M40 family metallo-hydrolase [Planctomycetaceae bacterium]